MKYRVNDNELSYEPMGEKNPGDGRVLLREAIDLTAGKPWASQGFTVINFLSGTRYKTFEENSAALLRQLWRKSGLVLEDDFQLDQYHRLASDQSKHLAAVEFTKLISVSEFPIDINEVENRISEICQAPLMAKNPFDGQSVFHFRVVRPNAHDNNPLHRDVWLEDYANCINLYIPIAGSNANSSLTLIPGSHHWPEDRVVRTTSGAILDGIKYNVPAVAEIKAPFEVVRPDPKRNEVLVFSPYLIHGGAANLNPDQTRISIELRLWKKSS